MLRVIFVRLISAVPVAILVVCCVTLLIHIIPGSPIDLILGDYATEQDRILLTKILHLDLPIWEQISKKIVDFFRGDLGISLLNAESVWNLLLAALFPTIQLTFTSMLCAMVLGISLGIFMATSSYVWLTNMMNLFSMLLMAIPNFCLGPLLIYVFSIQLNILPVTAPNTLIGLLLPSLTLGSSLAAILAQITKNSVQNTYQELFIRTAKSKGLKPFKILYSHVLKNAFIPILTILGLQFGVLLSGAVVTEAIFDWPGLGSLMFQAISDRDYPLIQGCVLLFSFGYILVNLITDILYSMIDPRITLSQRTF
jgi:peptide/nickel transport system permease protein